MDHLRSSLSFYIQSIRFLENVLLLSHPLILSPDFCDFTGETPDRTRFFFVKGILAIGCFPCCTLPINNYETFLVQNSYYLFDPTGHRIVDVQRLQYFLRLIVLILFQL